MYLKITIERMRYGMDRKKAYAIVFAANRDNTDKMCNDRFSRCSLPYSRTSSALFRQLLTTSVGNHISSTSAILPAAAVRFLFSTTREYFR